MVETSIVPLLPDAPLVQPEEAKAMWEEYQCLQDSILTDEDFLFFVEFTEWEETDRGTRKRLRRLSANSRADAQALLAKRPGAVISKRKVKSACRKMAKFFGYDLPETGAGQVEIRQEGKFTVFIERGDGYVHIEWLDAMLRTVKASSTVMLRSPKGRNWIGKGGAHADERFSEDFAIGETSFTRAVNRAILDAVGFGEESAEEVSSSVTLPGETPEEMPKRALGRARGEAKPPRPEQPPAEPPILKSTTDLFNLCWQEFGIQPAQVLQTAGYERAQDLEGQNLREVYLQVHAVHHTTAVPAQG